MTTIYTEIKRCAICDSESEFTGISSTNRFGSPDLDTRPPEMMRSTIHTWVQRCPQCGYCASDISELHPGAEDVVNEDQYRKQLNDQAYPDLANSFLCKSIIDRVAGEYASATWSFLHAAWVCYDANRPDEAVKCRHKAAYMLLTSEGDGQQVINQNGASTAILVDLLRRSGQFDEALRVIAEHRTDRTEDIICRILDFQTILIKNGDVSCHTISEALGEND
jgi:hypothetical protein